MCAVMLDMKTMLPPPRVGGGWWGDWDWWCLTKSWAAKKEPRDFFGVLDLDFLFFFSLFFFFFCFILERDDNIR